MNIISAVRRLAGRKGGKHNPAEQQQNLIPKRTYNLTTFASMRASLEDDDQKRLDGWIKSVRSCAKPFNNVRRLSDGSIVPFWGDYSLLTDEEKRNVILSSVNSLGQCAGLQRIVADKTLQRLGLPEEVVPTALKFAEQMISRVMEGKENATAKKE